MKKFHHHHEVFSNHNHKTKMNSLNQNVIIELQK